MINLNDCVTLGDYIQCAIETYEKKGIELDVQTAFSEGKRLQELSKCEWLDEYKERVEMSHA